MRNKGSDWNGDAFTRLASALEREANLPPLELPKNWYGWLRLLWQEEKNELYRQIALRVKSRYRQFFNTILGSTDEDRERDVRLQSRIYFRQISIAEAWEAMAMRWLDQWMGQFLFCAGVLMPIILYISVLATPKFVQTFMDDPSSALVLIAALIGTYLPMSFAVLESPRLCLRWLRGVKFWKEAKFDMTVVAPTAQESYIGLAEICQALALIAIGTAIGVILGWLTLITPEPAKVLRDFLYLSRAFLTTGTIFYAVGCFIYLDIRLLAILLVQVFKGPKKDANLAERVTSLLAKVEKQLYAKGSKWSDGTFVREIKNELQGLAKNFQTPGNCHDSISKALNQAVVWLEKPKEEHADQIHDLLERVTRAVLKKQTGDLEAELIGEMHQTTSTNSQDNRVMPQGTNTVVIKETRSKMTSLSIVFWETTKELALSGVTLVGLLAVSILLKSLWQVLPSLIEPLWPQLPNVVKNADWIIGGFLTIASPLVFLPFTRLGANLKKLGDK